MQESSKLRFIENEALNKVADDLNEKSTAGGSLNPFAVLLILLYRKLLAL